LAIFVTFLIPTDNFPNDVAHRGEHEGATMISGLSSREQISGINGLEEEMFLSLASFSGGVFVILVLVS
jgi:hypothetical protein